MVINLSHAKEYTISKDLQYELQRFVNNHDIAVLNRNLRRMLIDFLNYELRTGVPLYMDGFLFPFNNLHPYHLKL